MLYVFIPLKMVLIGIDPYPHQVAKLRVPGPRIILPVLGLGHETTAGHLAWQRLGKTG